MNAPPHPSRPLRALAFAVKWLLGLLLAGWLVLALAWGALHGWIVPRIGELRPALETEASRVLGVPVRIGSITARSEGLIPSFELQDVVLLDPLGRAALRLPRVLAALSPRSLWNLGFEQLYIDRPELDIRRAADGRIYVAGLDFSRSTDDEGRAADWFFSQTEFVIRDGKLQWTDEMHALPTLALQNVDFVMRNKARRHQLRLDATPPPEWGDRFSLSGLFRQPLLTARAGRWQAWVGQIYADFKRVDLSQLRQHAQLGVQIARGRGAVRAWADIERGLLVGGTADVILADVDATLGAQLAPLSLESVSGRLGGKRLANGFQFETQGLQFRTREGQRWPGGNLWLSWTGAEGRVPAQGELRADRLDLAALSQVASRLPLGTATHAALTAYGPKGQVETVQARWQGPLADPHKYEARGRATGLEIAARPAASGGAGSPGIQGAALDFDLTQGGGKAKLAIQKGSLSFPGVFEEPLLPFDTLSADLQWQLEGAQIVASVANLKFANVDAQGEGQANWRTTDPAKSGSRSRFPGQLDLQANLSRADGTRIWRYLPLGVSKNARDYVRASVQRGTATGARFRVKGNLHDFPFADGRTGEFFVTAQVKDVTYAYVPPGANDGPGTWPALTQLAGELVFRGNGMQIKDARGRLAGGPGLQVKANAQIPDFHTTTVSLTADVQGPLAESLAIVNSSPLAATAGQALAKARATGNADLNLKLMLPIGQLAQSQVRGTVTLAGNEVQVTPDTPMLSRARGAVVFSEHGFQLAGVQARALGGDVRLEGGSRTLPAAGGAPAEVAVQLRAQGTATAEGLRQARELGFASRLARDFEGSAAYQLTLGVRRGVPEIMVSSTLQGLALNLPAPLNKAAETALPLRYETALTRESLALGGRLQEQLTLELGRIASVNYLRDLSGPQAQVVRGSIGIGLAPGESAPLPDEGVTANIQLAALNIDAWEAVLDRAAGAEPGTAAASPLRGDGGAVMGYLPTVMAVRARDLSMEGQRLHNVVLGGSRDGRIWRANVGADELDGYLEYRQSSGAGAGAGRLHARLSRLNLAAAEASEVEALLDQSTTLPALDIVVDDFELKGRKLGRLEIDAVNRGPGAVAREGGIREWRLNKLSLATPEATFTASGNWAALNVQPAAAGASRPAAAPERRRTAVKFRLDIADAGQLLARFGMKDVVRRGRGALEGNISWLGSPLTFNYPTMTGSFNVNVESGQFLKADPGLAKLLGVLSLQSLPRRLALDFRDVFTEGFPFDFVRGDVAIEQGMASTNNLQMKGVNAAVLMEGKADIARETQDLKVVVVPEINAGTASLVATVINPAIGLGSFLAQMFLRQPLIRAATQEFHVGGTWSDPRVTKVNRAAAPTPTTTGQSETPPAR
jgi:uncharacterized protein (TIGR02099 family)